MGREPHLRILNMNRIVSIMFGILFLGLVVLASYLIVFRDEPQAGPPEDELPIGGLPAGGDIPMSGRVTMGTTQGNVSVKNPYKSAVGRTESSLILGDDERYHILYFPEAGTFLITLYQEPLSVSRSLAESEFLRLLDVRKEEACKLSVEVRVPLSVSEELAGQNLGLGICPGSRTLYNE